MNVYDITVGSYIQILEAMIAFMKKAQEHFEDEGVDIDTVIDTRLHPDMQPFSFQIMAVVVHSIDVVRALESGVFDPEPPKHEPTYAGLISLLEETCGLLDGYERDAIDALAEATIQTGSDGSQTASYYLLTHAMPNFYFHAATAYDILRMRGAPIGKLDFLGSRRIAVHADT